MMPPYPVHKGPRPEDVVLLRPLRGGTLSMTRRFATLVLLGAALSHAVAGETAEPLRIALFAVDATPPIGSPVAYAPVRKILDPLSARGLVPARGA